MRLTSILLVIILKLIKLILFQIVLESQPSNHAKDSESIALKMVFVVNSELKMGVGKIAAQVAHAGLGLQRVLLEGDAHAKTILDEWEQVGYVGIPNIIL